MGNVNNSQGDTKMIHNDARHLECANLTRFRNAGYLINPSRILLAPVLFCLTFQGYSSPPSTVLPRQ